jgi:hypothetical protein
VVGTPTHGIPALVDRRGETGDVADHAAAHGHYGVVAGHARSRHRAHDVLEAGQGLGLLAPGDLQPRVGLERLVVRRARVLDDETAPGALGVEEAGAEEATAEEHGMAPVLRARPLEPRALRRPHQGEEGGKCAAGQVARAGRQRGGRHRVIDEAAVRVNLVEAAPVAGQRPAAVGGAVPGVVGLHLEVHDGVTAERVADALRAERPAPERDDASVAAAQQCGHHLLLAPAEGRLAHAVEEGLDRLAQLAFELAVGIERHDLELGRHGAGGARLARPHEPDEYQGARGPLRRRSLGGRRP